MRTYPIGGGDPLTDGIVKSLFADSSGRLWVGTNSGGLARYDEERDRFVSYPEPPQAGNHGRVAAMLEDGANGLWIGTDAGLDHLEIDTGRFTHYHRQNDMAAGGQEYPKGRVTSLLRDPDGRLWVGTRSGLFLSNRDLTTFLPVKIPTADGSAAAVMTLLRDHSGGLWIGTLHGAFLLRQGATAAVALHSTDGGPDPENERIVSAVEAQPGVVWLGTYGDGVIAVTANDLKTWRIQHTISLPTSLSDNTVEALYRDRAGTTWVGTHRGLSSTNTVPSGIWTIFGDSDGKRAITDTDVYNVLPLEDGRTWLALSNSGVDILDANWKRTGTLRPDTKRAAISLPPGTVNALATTPDGNVYIGTSNGLYRSREDGSSLSHVPSARDSASSGEPDITASLYDAGRLWIGSDNGLWSLDKNTGGRLTQVRLGGALTDPRITVLLRGGGNDLWVGTQSGLSRVDVQTLQVERMAPASRSSSALSRGLISSMVIDSRGRLWVGTFAGLDILEGRDTAGKPLFHTLLAGLPNPNIDTLLQGSDGFIWAATDNGMARIDPRTLSIETVQDGPGISTFWSNAGAKAADGTLIFGGLGGILLIQPKLLRPWTYAPPVVITGVRIGDKELPASQLNDPGFASPLILRPDTNRFSVEFAALDYTAPEKNQYAYRLDGFDKEWITTDSTERLASYTNLPPGEYTLSLRGSNRAGLWAATRQLRLSVLPAWYQTGWFHICLAVLAITMAVLTYFGITAVSRQRQRELERLVQARTAELQDTTLKLQESQNKLEEMAFSDGLTGLPNRRMFADHLRQTLEARSIEAVPFGLLMFDLDYFKQINDSHGHDAGDAVLIAVANRLQPLMQNVDCFARLGGDEFAILLSSAADSAGVEAMCEKMVAAFAAPVLFGNLALNVSLSIGAVLYPAGGTSPDALYKSADLALYRAKHGGKSRWSW